MTRTHPRPGVSLQAKWQRLVIRIQQLGPIAAATYLTLATLLLLTAAITLQGVLSSSYISSREAASAMKARPSQQGGTAGKDPLPHAWRVDFEKKIPSTAAVQVKQQAKISLPRYQVADLQKMVKISPVLHGLIKKVGVTPAKYWHWTRKDQLMREWYKWGNQTLEYLEKGYPTTPTVPPSGCQVYINHLYRYIYIRNMFSASTFFEDIFGGECRGHLGDKPTCGQQLANYHANMDEDRAKKLWDGYVVFTATSNPWKRASAIYKFLEATPAKQLGRSQCTTHSWETFTRDPNVFGRHCEFHGCCRVPGNPTFEHQLVMSDAKCVNNLGRQSAVDYVIREDHIMEDLPTLIRELNKHANVHAEEIVLQEASDTVPEPYSPHQGDQGEHQGKLHWYWDDSWVGMYLHDDSLSFTYISMYYADDVKFFQYLMPRAISKLEDAGQPQALDGQPQR